MFLLLLLDDEQLSIVTSKFLERDEEVTQVKAELVVLGVEREQSLDKGCDLGTLTRLAVLYELRGSMSMHLRLQVAESILQ